MSRIKTYGGHAKRVIKLACKKNKNIPLGAAENDRE